MRTIVVFLILLAMSVPVLAQQHAVIIDIKGEVDPAMSVYTDRAIAEAEKSHSIIVLHINTFGGRLDVGTHIRDAVMNAKVPMTIAFIDKRAISAGALVALAAKKIIMAPGATFGAATPIYANGEKASEKVVSYMRAEMRSTAEHNGRNPDIAAAMVDEELGLDSISSVPLAKGKLLTLTNESAKQAKYVDFEADSISQALALVGFPTAVTSEISQGFSDEVIRFLMLPMVTSILILIGLSGTFYTIKTGHFGVFTLAAAGALVLFFSAQYLTMVAPLIALILFLAGVFLFLIELTPVPSFGIAAVLGVTGIFIGLFLALAGDLRALTPDRLRQTSETLAIAVVGLLGAIFIIFKYAPGWPWMRKFINQSVSSTGTAISESNKLFVGKVGTAITPLRPAGTALIDGAKVDVITNGEFVLPGTNIEVTQTAASKIIVRAI